MVISMSGLGARLDLSGMMYSARIITIKEGSM